MPPLSFDEASLDEILEVRGQPLTEKELWAVLLEGAKTLKVFWSKVCGCVRCFGFGCFCNFFMKLLCQMFLLTLCWRQI